MSELLKALYTLCKELDSQADAFGNSEYKKGLRNASNQLKAQLRAWDDWMAEHGRESQRLNTFRARILGVPPKEKP